MDKSLLSLPILPAIGLAGVSLGDSVDDVIALHGAPLQKQEVLEDAGTAEYDCFYVLYQKDRVITISAEDGYLGATLQGIYVGMPWLDLLEIHPDTYYDATWVWAPPGIDGIEFIIAIPPDGPSDPDEELEQQIEVSDPENAYVLAITVVARGERRGPWEAVHGKLAK